MMNNPKISVIIPVFNAHEYIRECIDSLVNQTLKEIEIICVNDGSTDDSLEILNEYVQRDSRIMILNQENSGAGAARNHGLRYACGEYLSIVDCDDFFEAEMLEESYCTASKRNADILVFGADFYGNETKQYSPCTYTIEKKLLPKKDTFCAEDVKQDVFKLFVGWSWDKLFRTSFVREAGLQFQEQRTTNDMLFVFGALLRAKCISVLPEVYAHHRQIAGSLSVTREKSWYCFHDALVALRADMQEIGCYQRFEQDFKNYYVHFSLWNLETLKEPTHTLLYNKLRDEWFEEMGVTEYPRSYFYNKAEYALFRKIYEHPIEWLEAEKRTIHGKISRGFKCVRDHGIIYTVLRAIKEITQMCWKLER